MDDIILHQQMLFYIYCQKLILDKYYRSKAAIDHNPQVRITWISYSGNMCPKLFRRRFRMTKNCFVRLCRAIVKGVGEEEFKSEAYLEMESKSNTKIGQIIQAHKGSCGGFVCGKVKLAIALRILGGGSYLDVSEIFHVLPNSCYPILHKITKEWIVMNKEFNINIIDYLENNKKMMETAFEFGKSSGNILRNIIGALDGWLVKIVCPTERDFVGTDEKYNGGNYHCRKGFYALNVQVIVDKNKKELWHSIKSIGSSHDLSAFRGTELYAHLVQISKRLCENQFFCSGFCLWYQNISLNTV